MSRSFIAHDGALLVVQALLVVLPGAGVPAWAARLRRGAWALVVPLSLVVVIGAIELLPDTADALTWLALVAVPLLAAAALGWAMRGARPWLALLAAPLLAAAWSHPDALAGQGATLALEALSCVTLGRLLAGVAPAPLLRWGIVVMAVIDSILVFSHGLHAPNAVLEAAVPAPGLPRLQFVQLGGVSFGYGDLFAAAVLGGLLAAERRPRALVAFLTFTLAAAFDLLFLVTNELPATVPVACAMLLGDAARRRGLARPRAVRGPARRRQAELVETVDGLRAPRDAELAVDGTDVRLDGRA